MWSVLEFLKTQLKMDIEIKRVGAFYLDERRRYVNSSVLGRTYLHLPKDCAMNLSVGFPEKFDFVKIPDEGITKVQRFLLDHEHLTRDVDFVTRRGTLANILNLSGYKNLDLHVSKSGSVIYMADAPRPDRKEGDIFEYCGRRFENIVFAGENRVKINFLCNGGELNVCPWIFLNRHEEGSSECFRTREQCRGILHGLQGRVCWIQVHLQRRN